MKKYLFVIALLASVISFSACSDDDEDIDVAQLEGTWGLTQEEGYDYYEGEKEEWNDLYDPANPTEDCEKIIVSKIADNIYSVVHYDYYNNKWNQSGTDKFSLDGSTLVPVDGSSEVSSTKLLVANSNQLIIEVKGTDEDGEFYGKLTYKRM